jgi:1-acyl-sn-glycerol-3-phosphate acyltransferase
MRALAYLAALTGLTVWHGGRAVLRALVGVRHQPGGSVYDRIQRAWGAALLRFTGIRVEVRGREQIPDRPVVFISNHASFVDIWALLAVLPGSPRFVAKKEFMYFPIMGQAMRAIGHIYIDRAKRTSAFASYDRAAEAIRRGVSAVVFAEGTRSRTGKLLPFKKGPFVLAIAAQVPIVPVCCWGTYERMPKGSITPTPGTVELRFGPPIPTAGLVHDDRDELSRRSREAMLRLGAVEAT